MADNSLIYQEKSGHLSALAFAQVCGRSLAANSFVGIFVGMHRIGWLGYQQWP
jgi:hypothetical protein